MIPVIPWFVSAIVVATNVVAALAAWSVVVAAAGRSDLSAAARRRVRIGALAFLGVWLVAAIGAAPAPASLIGGDPYRVTPLIPLFFAASFVGALVAIAQSSSLRRTLAELPLPGLVAVQAYRVIGVVFLVLLGFGQVPAHFALPAGWGDVAIGLAAPVVALALARRVRGARTLALTWNVLGLLDLAVAVGMGTGLLAPLLAPELGPHVLPVAAMGMFPMFLVPAFLVPLSSLLHALAIGRIVSRARFGVRQAPTAAA